MIAALKSMLPEHIKMRMKRLLNRTLPKPLGRERLARVYLKGQGIEIGALHNPPTVGRSGKVKYVARFSAEELKRQYPELRKLPLIRVDIVDDGEELRTLKDASQDFVIANHFIEHCQNPIRTISNLFRVLKKGGILYMALPDKRYTFDADRPVTSLEHIFKDYREGPENSRRDHYKEWIRTVHKVKNPEEAGSEVERLLKMNYSIHFHVWTQTEMIEMILALGSRVGLSFDIEACLKNKDEFIFVLRKTVTKL